MSVEEGGSQQLTMDYIRMIDKDTAQDHLGIILQKAPLHGMVQLDGRAVNEGEQFSYQDLSMLKVRLELLNYTCFFFCV